MTIRSLILSVLFVTLLGGCSGMTTREQRVLSGGAIGAGSGAAISIISGGSVGAGSAIGAAAGALGGFLFDESQR
jgi:osmotically inducible lipoprotein OsmB